jgi:hypothetical protein
MRESKDDLLSRAEEFERMAEVASTHVLRCRYQAMARYWCILAEQAERNPLLPIQETKTLSEAA